jgi:hypothetical protein
MNKGLWIARKNYLITLMKKVSKGYGGDTSECFDDICKEVLDKYTDESIEIAIRCYETMVDRLSTVPAAKPQTSVNQGIVYRVPFIDPREVSHG